MPRAVNGLKVCSKADCAHVGEAQGVKNFYKSRTSYDGLSASCKQCINCAVKKYVTNNREKVLAQRRAYGAANRERTCLYRREWWKNNRGRYQEEKKQRRLRNIEEARRKDRQYYLHTKYRVTPECVDSMSAAQGNCCKCCGDPFDESGRNRNVHHDHSTGEVVCILCRRCNLAEGFIQSAERAEKLWLFMKGGAMTAMDKIALMLLQALEAIPWGARLPSEDSAIEEARKVIKKL